jgi:hypothetical protein
MEKPIMYPRKICLTLATLSSLVLFAPWVSAGEERDHEHGHKQEHRQHGAHEHGVGTMNIAREGKEVHIELDSPAANIVGFEHAPKTEADLDTLEDALARLRNGTRLFLFPDAAGCDLVDADVDTPLKEHENGEEAYHTEEHHAHEDSHEHQGERHADITATWHFSCAHPEVLERVSVQLFEAFPMTERLLVQFITGKRQGAAELSASQPDLRL